jgi:bifunctional non-homologous end joining protein LigD
MALDSLTTYHKKRDFKLTAEPKGREARKSGKKLKFVIQMHAARRTHYDFRLEWNGVMKSWAVTRGPSFNPADKRLAVRTEDHPVEYNKFEGVIPEKQYGAGPVMIWDEGVWFPEDDPDKMEKKGRIDFTIKGGRMQGAWHLVRMRTQERGENWLLIKGSDDYALDSRANEKFMAAQDTSIITGRTMDEILEAGIGRTVGRKKAVAKKATKAPAKKSSVKKNNAPSLSTLMKAYDSPALATLVDQAPLSGDWVHEIKYDGYRLMAFISAGKVILRTRGNKDWTHKFEPLARALAKLDVHDAVLDLEACVLDEQGRTNFSRLQEALTAGDSQKIEGWVFDLLHHDGQDYRGEALLERKKVLAQLLKKAKPPLHYSDHFESAPDLLTKACKIGAEGLVSKQKQSTYHGRRTKDWLKSKCGMAQEFVIGGFMPSKDDNKAIGALLLGYYQGGKFLYAGKVGTGFSRKLAREIYKKLAALATEDNPFPEKPPLGLRAYVYVKPVLLCEVSFMEWTADKHIRHGSFKGLREDKAPKAVKQEVPEPVRKIARSAKSSKDSEVVGGVTITHATREVYPGTEITKGDVARYYERVAPLMLPFIKGRLISLMRCTEGINGQCFFQRNPMKGMGDAIKSKPVTHNGKKHEYLYVEDEKGILQLAQMGTLEFHSWQSTLAEKDKPNQIIFDLDPDPSVPFEAVKLGAEDVRKRLSIIGLETYARLSGGKGIHVVVPIKAAYKWDVVKAFARDFAEGMARDVPEAYVANMSKARRKGKIFIDFFRNDFSSTAIVPFSLRARDRAPLAWPVSWATLRKIDDPQAFRLNTLEKKDYDKATKAAQEFLQAQPQSLPQ